MLCTSIWLQILSWIWHVPSLLALPSAAALFLHCHSGGQTSSRSPLCLVLQLPWQYGFTSLGSLQTLSCRYQKRLSIISRASSQQSEPCC